MLKVLGRVSSINVRKVLWVLDELGLAYERQDWGAGFRNAQSPDFLALNPNGQVPVLIDDVFVLWESNAILRYLAEKHGQGALQPSDPNARAIVDQWLGWQASELNPAWSYAVMAILRKAPGFNDPARIDASIEAWNGKMQILNDQLGKTGAYATGPAFTIADIALGLSVHRWHCVLFGKPVLEHVERYRSRLLTRSAGARYMDETTP